MIRKEIKTRDPVPAKASTYHRVDVERSSNDRAMRADAPKAGRGRPSTGKVVVSIRLDPEVIVKFKTPVEKGWQGRINDALKIAKV